MSSIIEIRDLNKDYGQLAAVKHLNLSIDQGELYGFIGPNGAGKTSTLRMLATLLRPSSGDAWVAGHSVSQDPRGVRRVIGYMPDFFGVYDDMKVWEYLDFFAACYKIPENERARLIGDLLQLVELDHRREDFVDQLSRGMKQRLSLAEPGATPGVDPDEPASGLDPQAWVRSRADGGALPDGEDQLLLHPDPERRGRDLHPDRHP
jgi:ABC-2 type transport system ATP-binding protein